MRCRLGLLPVVVSCLLVVTSCGKGSPEAKPHDQPPSPTSSHATAPADPDNLPIPALHSRPASTHTIYLDFDGVEIGPDNHWVKDESLSAGTYAGFALPSHPAAGFDQGEVDFIRTVWQFVSEKYVTFDVDVTTEDPGAAAYTRTDAADVHYGVHMAITSDPRPPKQLCNDECTGLSGEGNFDVRDRSLPGNPVDPTLTVDPNWVFAIKTVDSVRQTALLVCHEIGHTFYLSHDGTRDGNSYYDGQGMWVPIMGASNVQALSQFSDGDYANANNDQDDLTFIAARGDSGAEGSLRLPDDFVTASGSPTGPAILGDKESYDVHGMISQESDDDVFSVTRSCTLPLKATATGTGLGQALDIKVSILDESGSVLASDDPPSAQHWDDAIVNNVATGLDASATVATTTAGTTYQIKVDGVGHGDSATGYSAYGSIGSYDLKISGCPN